MLPRLSIHVRIAGGSETAGASTRAFRVLRWGAGARSRNPERPWRRISDRVARAFDLAGITNAVGMVHAKMVKGGPPPLLFH